MTPAAFDKKRLLDILFNNQGKNFVQRILRPEDFPVMDLGGGTSATHMMAWGQHGNKFVVFPSIQMEGSQLKDFGKSAFDRAIKAGEFIEFDNPAEADWFSKNYKSVWDRPK